MFDAWSRYTGLTERRTTAPVLSRTQRKLLRYGTIKKRINDSRARASSSPLSLSGVNSHSARSDRGQGSWDSGKGNQPVTDVFYGDITPDLPIVKCLTMLPNTFPRLDGNLRIATVLKHEPSEMLQVWVPQLLIDTTRMFCYSTLRRSRTKEVSAEGHLSPWVAMERQTHRYSIPAPLL